MTTTITDPSRLLPDPLVFDFTRIQDRVRASRYLSDGAFVTFRKSYKYPYTSGKSPFDGKMDDQNPASYQNYYKFIQQFEAEKKKIRSDKRYTSIAKKAGYKSHSLMLIGDKKKAEKVNKIAAKNTKKELIKRIKEGKKGNKYCYIVQNWIGSPRHLRKGVNYFGFSKEMTNHKIVMTLRGKKLPEIVKFINSNISN